MSKDVYYLCFSIMNNVYNNFFLCSTCQTFYTNVWHVDDKTNLLKLVFNISNFQL